MVPRVFAGWGVSGIDGPRPAATYQEIQGKQGLRNKETEQILTRRWADGPANFLSIFDFAGQVPLPSVPRGNTPLKKGRIGQIGRAHV